VEFNYVITLYVASANKFNAWIAESKHNISKDFTAWNIRVLKDEEYYTTYQIRLLGKEEKIRYFMSRVGEVTRVI
jgi:hypothetical protein